MFLFGEDGVFGEGDFDINLDFWTFFWRGWSFSVVGFASMVGVGLVMGVGSVVGIGLVVGLWFNGGSGWFGYGQCFWLLWRET